MQRQCQTETKAVLMARNPDRIVLVASLVCLTCFVLSLAKDPSFGVSNLGQSSVATPVSAATD